MAKSIPDGDVSDGDRPFVDPFNPFTGTYPAPVTPSSTGFINYLSETGGAIDSYSYIAPPRRTRRDLRGR